jgi:hypothetical protein
MDEWLGHRRRLLTPYRQAVRHCKKTLLWLDMARTRSARMRLPRRQWEDEGTRSNNALVTQVDPLRTSTRAATRVDAIQPRPFR